MAKHRGVARDEFGNSLSGASVTVYDPGTTTEATLYSDVELATALDNPFTVEDDGSYVFYVDPGVYDIQVAKSGFTTKTLSDEKVGQSVAVSEIAMTNSMTIDNSYDNKINDTDGGAGSIALVHGPEWSLVATTGVFTYDGNATIKAEVTVSGRLYVDNTFAGNTIYIVVQKNGSGAEWSIQRYLPGTGSNNAVLYHKTEVMTIENGDTLSLPIFSSGAPFGDVIVRDGYFSIRSLD